MLSRVLFRLFCTVCLSLFSVFAYCASAQEIQLRMAHAGQTTEPLHVLGTKWAELLGEQSKGRVTMKVYPQGQLGDEKSLAEQLRLGTVDATMIAADVLTGSIPEISVIGLPFAFDNYAKAHNFLDGPGGKLLLRKMDATGLKGIGFVDTGFRSIGNKVRPIRVPEDLAGLKIREIPSPLVLDTIKALGGNAVPIPWAETVSALKQGVVDGVGTTPSFFWSAQLWQYTQYFSYTQHLYTANVVLFSSKTFEKLPKDLQTMVIETGLQAIEHTRKYVADVESKLTENLESKGVKVNKVDLAPFRKRAQPVWAEYEPKIGPELMGYLREASSN
jgi:TRAP-type transport system periplasmic protein